MSRLQHLQRPPAYCLHKPTNQAYATAPASEGKARHPVYFGIWGTEASFAAYQMFLKALGLTASVAQDAAERARDRCQKPAEIPALLIQSSGRCTIRQLWSLFNQWAKGYYRSAVGEPTGEADNFADAVKELLDLYGDTQTADFRKSDLESIQQLLVDRKLSRGVVNKRLNRIRRVFLWGTEDGRTLVPEYVAVSLTLVRRLEPHRSDAKECEPIRGVDPASVEKAAAAANPVVRAMMLLQLYTGMRPGEVRGLRKRMVRQAEGIWIADFGNEHKNAHRKQSRVVALGPKAVELLTEWLALCEADSDFVFRPTLQKGSRGKLKQFTRYGYADSIHWACQKVDVPSFAPNQIRHTAAEEIRKSDGLEAVQAVLGHKSRASSERYAPAVAELATVIAKKRG